MIIFLQNSVIRNSRITEKIKVVLSKIEITTELPRFSRKLIIYLGQNQQMIIANDQKKYDKITEKLQRNCKEIAKKLQNKKIKYIIISMFYLFKMHINCKEVAE